MIDDLKNIKSGKKELREFGITIGVILILLGVLVMWRGKSERAPYLFLSGAIFLALAFTFRRILMPAQKIWMGFSVIMGFFVSRIILFMLFYVAVTPIGLIARLFGKDLLEQRIDRTKETYWCDRETGKETRESYENQY